MAAGGHTSQALPQYSIQLIAEQTNPWVLPQTSEESLDLQQSTRFRKQPKRTENYQMGRFVTPEVLESLKQQQIQTQLMPKSRENNQLMRQKLPFMQAAPQQAPSIFPGQGYYGSPSYGMDYVNPLYTAPAVPPWGSGPDVIYRGESLPGLLPDGSDSLPWVPSEAMGGMPPMHIPSWGENNSEQQIEDNVFNPFTFIPNRNLQ